MVDDPKDCTVPFLKHFLTKQRNGDQLMVAMSDITFSQNTYRPSP